MSLYKDPHEALKRLEELRREGKVTGYEGMRQRMLDQIYQERRENIGLMGQEFAYDYLAEGYRFKELEMLDWFEPFDLLATDYYNRRYYIEVRTKKELEFPFGFESARIPPTFTLSSGKVFRMLFDAFVNRNQLYEVDKAEQLFGNVVSALGERDSWLWDRFKFSKFSYGEFLYEATERTPILAEYDPILFIGVGWHWETGKRKCRVIFDGSLEDALRQRVVGIGEEV